MDKHFNGKPCNKCGATLRYIAQRHCVACKKLKDAEYAKANPEKRNAAKIKWQNDNRAKHNESVKKWNNSHPDIMNANTAKRRVRRINATTYPEYDWLIQAFYTRARQLTELTGIPHEVEHIIPLHGKNEAGEHVVCGLHIPTNLDILPMAANRAKSCKFSDAEWHENYDMAA